MRHLLVATLVSVSLAAPVAASQATDELYDALSLDRVITVMRKEGLSYGEDLQQDLLSGNGGAAWDRRVAEIYDSHRMEDIVRAEFAQELDDTEVTPLLDFFTAPLGSRIVRLEAEARQTLSDPDVEAAAESRVAAMREEDDPRLAVLQRFVEVNDLLDSNVVGAMNANLAFYKALMEGDGAGVETSEADLLSDVWAQESDIRDDTRQWLFSYLALAYQPLSEDELQRYVELSATPEGQALNRALFAAFDRMYIELSRDLGSAAAEMINSTDI